MGFDVHAFFYFIIPGIRHIELLKGIIIFMLRLITGFFLLLFTKKSTHGKKYQQVQKHIQK